MKKVKQEKKQKLPKKEKTVKAAKPAKTAKAAKPAKAVKTAKPKKATIFNSLITKTVIAFALLILMIVVQGVMSYVSAKDMLIGQAEDALVTTIKAKGDYMELGLEQVSDRMIEILTGDDLMYFYITGTIDYGMLDEDQSKVKTRVQENLRSMKQISDFVYQLYFFSSKTVGLTTTPMQMTGDYYKNFTASGEGSYIANANEKYGYFGKHAYLDETVYAAEDTFKSTEYAISIWRKVSMKAGSVIFVVDIDRSVIYNSLVDLDNGEGSYAAFVAPDNNETIYCGGGADSASAPVFSELAVYQQALASEETEGFLQTT